MATDAWNAIDVQKREFPLFYCAFLDMLGYKEKSDLFFDNRFNLPGRIERAMATAATSILVTSALVDISQITIESFSDSIVILQPVDHSNIGALLLLSAIFASKMSFESLCLRGGIAMGRHSDSITKTGFRVLTSEALQKAYILESKQARMPRILIDPEVVNTLSAQEKSMIIRDGDDFMLHYANLAINRQGVNLNDVYCEMRDIQEVRDSSDVDIREKCQWMLDYYYWTICQIPGSDSSRFLPFTSIRKNRFTFLNEG